MQIKAHDANGQQVLQNAYSGIGELASSSFTPKAEGEAFLTVADRGLGGTGDLKAYNIIVSDAESAPPVQPLVSDENPAAKEPVP